jgi:hypothetical protein
MSTVPSPLLAGENPANDLVSPKVKLNGFQNVIYPLDLALMQMFAAELFSGDLSFITYADNAFCFHRRTIQNKGVLKLPFLHMKSMNVTQEDPLNWYSAPAAEIGIWSDTLGTRIRMTPIMVTYESNIWCSSDIEAKTLMNRLLFSRQNHQLLEYDILAESLILSVAPETEPAVETIKNIANLNFEKIETGTEFAEKDWLEKNKLFQVNTAFTVNTFALKLGARLYPCESVLFEFCPTMPFDATLAEQYNFIVDSVFGTLTEV